MRGRPAGAVGLLPPSRVGKPRSRKQVPQVTLTGKLTSGLGGLCCAPGLGDPGTWGGLENFLLWRFKRPKHLGRLNTKVRKKKGQAQPLKPEKGTVKWRDRKCEFPGLPQVQLRARSSSSPTPTVPLLDILLWPAFLLRHGGDPRKGHAHEAKEAGGGLGVSPGSWPCSAAPSPLHSPE